MSTVTERITARFGGWLDRLLLADNRYICGGCDDRFQSRSQGIEHVQRCHPEYRGVIVYDDATELIPAATRHSRPTRMVPALVFHSGF